MLEFITEIDHTILMFIQENLRADWLTPIMRFFTGLGEVGIFWIVLSLVLLCFKKTRKAGFWALVSLLVCFIITNLGLKNIVARMRPYHRFEDILPLAAHPGDFSFPSGHTASAFAAAGIYIRYLDKRWGIVLIVVAALIAISRLYLGMHYPTDVLAGLCTGLISSLIVYFAAEKIMQRRRQVQ